MRLAGFVEGGLDIDDGYKYALHDQLQDLDEIHPDSSTSPQSLSHIDAEDAAVVAHQGDREEDRHPQHRPERGEEIAAQTGAQRLSPNIINFPAGASVRKLFLKELPPTASSAMSTPFPFVRPRHLGLEILAAIVDGVVDPQLFQARVLARRGGADHNRAEVFADLKAAVPTPPAAACTRTRCPFLRLPKLTSMCHGGQPDHRDRRACAKLKLSGMGRAAGGTRRGVRITVERVSETTFSPTPFASTPSPTASMSRDLVAGNERQFGASG